MNREFFVMVEKINQKINVLEQLKIKIHSGEYISSEIDDMLITNELIDFKADLYSDTQLSWLTKTENQIEILKNDIYMMSKEYNKPNIEEEINYDNE